MNTKNLASAIEFIIEGNQYYSATVKSCISEIWKKDVMVDEQNRKILNLLSKGLKIKEIESVMSLTSSAIQKRVEKMKHAFKADSTSALIQEASALGYI